VRERERGRERERERGSVAGPIKNSHISVLDTHCVYAIYAAGYAKLISFMSACEFFFFLVPLFFSQFRICV